MNFHENKLADVKCDHYRTYEQIRKHILNAVPDRETANSLIREVDAIVNSSRQLGYEQAVYNVLSTNPNHTGHRYQDSPVIEEDLEIEFKVEPQKPFGYSKTRQQFMESVGKGSEVYWVEGSAPCRIIGSHVRRSEWNESTPILIQLSDGVQHTTTISSIESIDYHHQFMDTRNEFIQTVSDGDEVWHDGVGPDDSGYATVIGISQVPGNRCEETPVLISFSYFDNYEAMMEDLSPSEGV